MKDVALQKYIEEGKVREGQGEREYLEVMGEVEMHEILMWGEFGGDYF